MTAFDPFRVPLQGSHLIEASAGTGKTWNLCGLVLRLVLEAGIELPRVLVVTFTQAATAELRERIRDRLRETADALASDADAPAEAPADAVGDSIAAPPAGDPFVPTLLRVLTTERGIGRPLLRQRAQAALAGFDEAAVMTIHGFCQRALADAAFSAGMPLALEPLADDGVLRDQAVQDAWRRCVAHGSLPPLLLRYLLAQGDAPDAWSQRVRQHLAKPLAQVRWPAGCGDDAPGFDAALALLDDGPLRAAHQVLQQAWQADADGARRRLAGACAARGLHGGAYKPQHIDDAFDGVRSVIDGSDPAGPATLPAKLALLASTTLAQRANKGHAPPQHPLFDAVAAWLAAREALTAAVHTARLHLLRQLLRDAPAALREHKRELGVVGYDDMLFNLHERLHAEGGAALAQALRQRFAAALIDEFQDTDPLQWGIFQRLYGTGPAPLFLVGDPKQAIYGFRGADLPTYLQAREATQHRHTLRTNQRSTPEMLSGLNALFGTHDRPFLRADLAHPPVTRGDKALTPLHDDGDDHAGPGPAAHGTAPWQLWMLPGADGEPMLRKDEARDAAARATAAEIARLLARSRAGRLRLGARPVAGSDIAVLVRTHAEGALVQRALAALGVGSVELSRQGIHATPDAEDLERILRAVLDPADDAALRAALATDAMGLDATALARPADAAAGTADDDALAGAAARFAGWRDTWHRRGVAAMLRAWMRDQQVAARLLQRPDGERRLTNLLHLAERLQQAASDHPTPQALLRWLRQQRRDGTADDEAQLRLDSDGDLVKVITIHRAKGLEHPIVFCPMLFDGDRAPPVPGPGVAYTDEDGATVFDYTVPPKDKRVQALLRAEKLGERLRLLYVALTRAVHRCHLVVGLYAAGKRSQPSTRESCAAPLNWLVAGGTGAAAWYDKPPVPATIAAAWAGLAARAPLAVALLPLPTAAGRPLAPSRPPPDAVAALPPPAALPRRWRIGSFSSLALDVRHDAAAVDHDQHAGAPDGTDMADIADTAVADSPAADDIARFPRGPAAGDCLHAVFERADFADATTWPAAIDGALRDAGALAADEHWRAHAPAQLRRMLHDVMHTPLLPGLTLGSVPAARRRAEVEFHLPAAALDTAALGNVMARHGLPVPAFSAPVLQGWLHGFIDLVFEHAGRWHVLDWKSNHLGDAAADYGQAALDAAMARHAYPLQGLLYAVALHRLLRLRLRGYRPEQHLGEVLYLFVRGVRPGWRDAASGQPAGVWAFRPGPALLDEVSALLQPAPEPRP